MKKKMGRPRLDPDKLQIMPIMSVRLATDEFNEVERLAQQRGQTRSHFMRQIVRDAIATQKKNQEVVNAG